jgi:hypothetical protein
MRCIKYSYKIEIRNEIEYLIIWSTCNTTEEITTSGKFPGINDKNFCKICKNKSCYYVPYRFINATIVSNMYYCDMFNLNLDIIL